MINKTTIENGQGLAKLSGRILNYRKKRDSASFVFSKSDQNKMGAVAIAASLAGLSGAAVSTASNAASVEEEADFVEFDLDGKAVKGWVWRSPFAEGDQVEVAGEWHADHFEAFGIARPSDRTVAMYPHCSRGRSRHIKNAFKWWMWLGFLIPNLMYAALMFFIGGMESLTHISFPVVCAALTLFTAAMFASLSRRWMPFVTLAEKVFKTLGWKNPSDIDLVRTSAARKECDPAEFGTFYFRY